MESTYEERDGFMNPATKIVHWPSGPVAACNNHATQLMLLAQVMGMHVGIESAPEGAECKNCENEKARRVQADVPD